MIVIPCAELAAHPLERVSDFRPKWGYDLGLRSWTRVRWVPIGRMCQSGNLRSAARTIGVTTRVWLEA